MCDGQSEGPFRTYYGQTFHSPIRETGMAGGDQIHFAMQLDGVQIDPKEWRDAHWINDHIAKRVDLPGFNSPTPELLTIRR
jgi:hypothetical protein